MPRPFQPVAIVAATCILPGAHTLDDLWRAFEEETTAIGRAPDAWLNRSVYYSDDPLAPNRTYSQTAALLPPWEFSRPPRLPPRQTASLDPTHRLALETGQRITDSLADVWLPREKTGVWVANISGANSTQQRMLAYHSSQRWARRAAAIRPDAGAAIRAFQKSFQNSNPFPMEDGAANSNILPGRIANYFDLQGPQFALDAKCASSLAALRGACLSLEDGTCDMALVASIGVQSPEQLVVVAKARAFAPRPSFPFDRDSCGFVPAEGAVMVALVRAEDAERRGLRTLGVIRSIGTSLNGSGSAPWSPSEAAERTAITRAWQEGEFDPDSKDGRIDYIEAHGTATPLGDRTEHASILATYGKAAHRGPIPFGSVKSMIGHTWETAGLAGLLRALYVFDRGRIPPTVGVEEPAPYVAAQADRLRLVRHNEPAAPAQGRIRRVAVSSFGIGGINYHALVESAPAAGSPPPVRRRPSREPIAVVGASAIMPDAPDIDAVWEQLRSGTAVRKPLADHIADFDLYHDSDGSHRDRTVCPVSAVVGRQTLGEPLRWRVLPKAAAYLLDDHVLLLNAASRLAADGAVPSSPEVQRRSGVYVTDIQDSDSRNAGVRIVLFERWWDELRRDLTGAVVPGAVDEIERGLRGDKDLGLRPLNQDDSTSGEGALGASRIASGLGLTGAAVTVNSACASGLAALAMAMQELRSGSLDFALVGGASLAIDESNQVVLSAIGGLSPSGVVRPYDKEADGFVIGSGAALFALKRLSDAERDGDRVLAVVRECVGNSDGKGQSLLAPGSRGRHEVLRRTYGKAAIGPETVQYVEGHGSGSRLGDHCELQAIADELGTPGRPVQVGSVKGNYGHLKGPAGIAGLLKVVLCLRNGMLVPTPGFARPGDLPGLTDGRVRVVDACTRWPGNGALPRRAGINAFGLGGANFHAIVDEYRPGPAALGGGAEPSAAAASGTASGSTRDTASVVRVTAASARELLWRLSDRPPAPAAQPAGGAEEWRAALVVPADRDERSQQALFAARMAARVADHPCEATDMGAWAGPQARTGPVVALFPGQAGAQHFEAVAWLAAHTEHGPATLEQLEDVLGGAGRTIRGALADVSLAGLGDLRSRSGTSQVLGLLASYLVWRWFDERTDTPVTALGHSAGEIAALVAAGSVSLDDAIGLCWQRGLTAEAVTRGRDCLMAAVWAEPGTVQRFTDSVCGAYLATVNGPKFCVVAGWADAVHQVLEKCRTAGVDSTRLDVRQPFHTPLLADAVDELRGTLADIAFSQPRLPVFSAVLNGPYPADSDADTIRDTVAALYVEPIRLDQLIGQATRLGTRRFVECGVGRSLTSSVNAVLSGTAHLTLAGVTRPGDALHRLDAGLWVAGLSATPAAASATTRTTAAAPTAAVDTAAAAEKLETQETQETHQEQDEKKAPVDRTTQQAPRSAQPRERGRVSAPAPGSGGFRLFTPVTVPAEPWVGGSWDGVPLLVAGAQPGPLAGEVARELAAAGARVDALDVAELSGHRTTDQAASVPVSRLQQTLGKTPGPRWLVWVSAGAGAAGQEPLSGCDGARTLAELACLRAVVKALAEGWELHGTGGLLLVTAMDGRLGGSRARLDPSGGALAGFARALSHEFPQAAIAMVDVGRDVRPSAAARRIALMGLPPEGHRELGLSADGCWTGLLTALPVAEPAEPDGPGPGLLDALREPDAVIMVSGGTTGIVAHMLRTAAERLSGPLPGRLVLLSRTSAADKPVSDLATALERLHGEKGARLVTWRREHPERSLHEFERHWRRRLHALEARSTLTRLRGTGVEVDHEVIDVCDVRAVHALGERLRLLGLKVRTIVHGAGVERSSRITDKPADEWETTAAVKIAGFHNLVDAAGDGLRLVIAHGSVSGTLGLPGQTDYAAGNEYLATAVSRLQAEHPELTARCVAWPAWDRVGLATAPQTKRLLEGAGLRYLLPDRGARWASAIISRAPVLPPRVVLLPVPVPPSAAARTVLERTPAEPWWLVDTVTWQGTTASVRRHYDTSDPRDAEIGDHRVRGNIRIAGVQILEQVAEAFLATLPSVPERIELRDLVLRQGLVTATSGRRPVTVVVSHDAVGTARLQLETTPLLGRDFPGPGSVLVATGTAGVLDAGEDGGRAAMDLDLARPLADVPDAIELARQFGIGYTGRFAVSVVPLSHPGADLAGRFTPGAPPERFGRFVIDPATLDIAARTVFAASGSKGELGLPSSIERVVLRPGAQADPAGDRYVFVAVLPSGGYDLLLTDSHGRPLVDLQGLRLRLPSDMAAGR